MTQICAGCGKPPKITPNQFWTLNHYYGISGLFCAECFDKVSHDSHGNPENPAEYVMFLLKQEKKNGKEKTY